jgi:hypothetical protein
MKIKQSVINTFNRVGIEYQKFVDDTDTIVRANRFTGETVNVSPLIAVCIDWVYRTSNMYEMGNNDISVSDFDRVRYFILDNDSKAYNVCID